MPPIITKQPTSIEIWILKWIFLPLLIGAFLFIAINMTIERHQCVTLCEEKGYKFADYSPGSARLAREATCSCESNGQIFKIGH